MTNLAELQDRQHEFDRAKRPGSDTCNWQQYGKGLEVEVAHIKWHLGKAVGKLCDYLEALEHGPDGLEGRLAIVCHEVAPDMLIHGLRLARVGEVSAQDVVLGDTNPRREIPDGFILDTDAVRQSSVKTALDLPRTIAERERTLRSAMDLADELTWPSAKSHQTSDVIAEMIIRLIWRGMEFSYAFGWSPLQQFNKREAELRMRFAAGNG